MDEQDDIKIEAEVEDLSPRDTESDESAEAAEGKIRKLKADIETLRKEKQEYMDGWQRAKADYVNALKRFETDATASEFKGKMRAVETLLPAFDALERAKEHGEIPEGFLAIAKQLEGAFAVLGLEETGRVGTRFDPAYHEALGQDNVESADKDDIITVILEKGWRVGDIVIRPAKVRIGHFSN